MREFWAGIAAIIGLIALGFVVGIWVGEPSHEAYERGCKDRDSLWIAAMQELTDKLAGQLDSTDTLPAVNSVDATPRVNFPPWPVDTAFVNRVLAEEIDTFYMMTALYSYSDSVLIDMWGERIVSGWRDFTVECGSPPSVIDSGNLIICTVSVEALKNLYRASPMLIPDPTDIMPAVDSAKTPWFWSDSAVMNDEHWMCPNDEGWGFLPSCVLRDSLPDVCILRFPDMIIFWDTKLMDGTNIYRAGPWMTLEE